MNSRTLKSLLSNIVPDRLNNKGMKVILDVDDTSYYIRRSAEELSKVDPNRAATTVELRNAIFLLGVVLYRMEPKVENANNPKLPKRSRGTDRSSDNQATNHVGVDSKEDARQSVSVGVPGPVGGASEVRPSVDRSEKPG